MNGQLAQRGPGGGQLISYRQARLYVANGADNVMVPMENCQDESCDCTETRPCWMGMQTVEEVDNRRDASFELW